MGFGLEREGGFGSVVVEVVVMGRRREGTDTRAERGLRIVRERMLGMVC